MLKERASCPSSSDERIACFACLVGRASLGLGLATLRSHVGAGALRVRQRPPRQTGNQSSEDSLLGIHARRNWQLSPLSIAWPVFIWSSKAVESTSSPVEGS
jgi:hypothetical protein